MTKNAAVSINRILGKERGDANLHYIGITCQHIPRKLIFKGCFWLTFSFNLFYRFSENCRVVSSVCLHHFGLYPNLCKNERSHDCSFDGAINLKLSNNQDIDLKYFVPTCFMNPLRPGRFSKKCIFSYLCKPVSQRCCSNIENYTKNIYIYIYPSSPPNIILSVQFKVMNYWFKVHF